MYYLIPVIAQCSIFGTWKIKLVHCCLFLLFQRNLPWAWGGCYVEWYVWVPRILRIRVENWQRSRIFSKIRRRKLILFVCKAYFNLLRIWKMFSSVQFEAAPSPICPYKCAYYFNYFEFGWEEPVLWSVCHIKCLDVTLIFKLVFTYSIWVDLNKPVAPIINIINFCFIPIWRSDTSLNSNFVPFEGSNRKWFGKTYATVYPIVLELLPGCIWV